MSDNTDLPNVPAEAAAPAPVQPAPAPQQPTAPADPGAPAAAAPPEKKRPVLAIILAVIAVVIAIVLCAVGTVLWGAYQDTKRVENVQEQAAEIDAGIEQILSDVEELDRQWQGVTASSDPASLEPLVAKTASQTAEYATQVEALKKQAKSIESTTVAAAYELTLQRMAFALSGNENKGKDAMQQFKTFAAVSAASTALDDGMDDFNRSVEQCNARNYNKGIASANLAKAHFAKARDSYKKAQQADPGAVTSSDIAYAAAFVTYADMQKKLAEVGKRGGVSSYNSQIRKIEAYRKKIDKMEGSAVMNGLEVFSDVKASNGGLLLAMKSARESWDDAKKLVQSEEF